jgi:hypothetical protein
MRQWASLSAILDHHKLALILLHKCVEYVLGCAVTTLDTTALVIDTLAETLNHFNQWELGNLSVFIVHQNTGSYSATNTSHPEPFIVGRTVLSIHTGAQSLAPASSSSSYVVHHVLHQGFASHSVVVLQGLDDLNLIRHPMSVCRP